MKRLKKLSKLIKAAKTVASNPLDSVTIDGEKYYYILADDINTLRKLLWPEYANCDECGAILPTDCLPSHICGD